MDVTPVPAIVMRNERGQRVALPNRHEVELDEDTGAQLWPG